MDSRITGCVLIAQRITGGRNSSDQQRRRYHRQYTLSMLCTLVGVHLQDTADALLLAFGRVQNIANRH